MFLGSFAWSFVFVSLPFHIQRLSTTDPVSTLRWTGWILGISSLVTVATAPFWGRFVVGGAVLLACAAMARWLVEPPSQAAAAPSPDARPVQPREVGIVALIVLGASIQVFFFTSILPRVLPDFGIGSAETLEIGGTLIFVSGVAAALGAMAVPRLADLFAESRLIGVLLVTSSLWLGGFAAARPVLPVGAVPFLPGAAVA